MTETTQANLWKIYVNTAEKSRQEGNYEKAEKMLTNALIDLEDSAGKHNVVTADVQRQLANVYRLEKRYCEADACYKQALAILESDYENDYQLIVAILEELAISLCEQGLFDEAIPLRERAITLLVKHVDDNRPQLQVMHRKLAATCLTAQEYDKARLSYQKLLEATTTCYGSIHSEIADLENHLALTYYLQEDFILAEALYLKSLATQQLLGNPQATWTANELGLVLCAQGKHELAQHFCHRALEDRQVLDTDVIKTESEQIANCLSELADVYCSKNNFAEAAPLCKQALASRLQLPPSTTYDRQGKMRLYAYLLRKSGRDDEASRIEANADIY